ncbi:tyrosine-type recombinase/integrase [Rhodococcus pyridinivorans]
MAGTTRRGWGMVRRLPSGRYQASYVGPDLARHNAPATFAAKVDAEGWLGQQRRLVDLGVWTPPGAEPNEDGHDKLTVAIYARRWLEEAQGRLKPRTIVLYRGYLENLVLPDLGDVPLAELTAPEVRRWRAGLDPAYPTRNANAYALLRGILAQAVDDELLPVNPARVRGGAVKHRKHEPVALTAAEIRALAAALPKRWAVVALLAGFGGLRIGEIQGLRRRDLTLTDAEVSVTVRRAVVRVAGEWRTDRPKSRASLRTVPLPPGLRPILEAHLREFAEPGREGLVVVAAGGKGVVHRDSIAEPFKRAAASIGHPTLRMHDLRHSALTLWGNAGATLADLMTMAGHTSASMAARYTHSTAARNAALAAKVWEQ